MDCSPNDGAASQLMRRLHRGRGNTGTYGSVDDSNPEHDSSVDGSSRRKAGPASTMIHKKSGCGF